MVFRDLFLPQEMVKFIRHQAIVILCFVVAITGLIMTLRGIWWTSYMPFELYFIRFNSGINIQIPTNDMVGKSLPSIINSVNFKATYLGDILFNFLGKVLFTSILISLVRHNAQQPQYKIKQVVLQGIKRFPALLKLTIAFFLMGVVLIVIIFAICFGIATGASWLGIAGSVENFTYIHPIQYNIYFIVFFLMSWPLTYFSFTAYILEDFDGAVFTSLRRSWHLIRNHWEPLIVGTLIFCSTTALINTGCSLIIVSLSHNTLSPVAICLLDYTLGLIIFSLIMIYYGMAYVKIVQPAKALLSKSVLV
ncbi:hypothetical protein [unidentified bacterial endosymbiont]|uniref:hypothetical protein n=1 Tax=unidentified bacterial endosymbiont TaxID=2355 RepID=UPI00209DC6CB|nr:hypothetical protein [unidentified bacterial endosymbiont]